MSSSSTLCFLLPYTRQIAIAIPPSRIAPPTPPTTPPIVFLDVSLKPALPELPLLPFNVALVDAAKTVLLVWVAVVKTPLLV